MPGGNDLAIANVWKGLNRRIAPHLLDETESPDTVDADNTDGQLGILGPRKGRARVHACADLILGLVGFSAPWGRQRICCTADGAWTPEDIPWPAPIVPPVPDICGWDRVRVILDTVSQTGIGETVGPTELLPTPLNMADYGAIVIAESNLGYGGINITETPPVEGYINFQIRRGGVWFNLWRINLASGGPDGGRIEQFFTAPGSGSFDAVRANAVVTAGAGTIFLGAPSVVLNLYLVRGAEGVLETIP